MLQQISHLSGACLRNGLIEIGDDSQHLSRIELCRVCRQHHAHTKIAQQRRKPVRATLIFRPLSETSQCVFVVDLVNLCIGRILQSINQYDLALDVLNDLEQKLYLFPLGEMIAMLFKELLNNFNRGPAF